MDEVTERHLLLLNKFIQDTEVDSELLELLLEATPVARDFYCTMKFVILEIFW